jgi:hypothetical protein
MYQTIIVYSILIIVMMKYASIASKRAQINLTSDASIFHHNYLAPIMLFSIVFGIRYDVGVDYFSYLDQYSLAKYQNEYSIEMIYEFITRSLSQLNIHYTIYFTLLALIQIIFLYATFKDEPKILFYLIFILFAGRYFMDWMNIIRQSIAFCIFVYSVSHIKNRNPFKFIVLIFIAAGFHKSALILLPIYLIFSGNKDIYKSRYFQVILLAIALALNRSESIISLIRTITGYFPSFGYEQYVEIIFYRTKQLDSGIGFILSLFIDAIIILYSTKLKLFHANSRFLTFFNIYFSGRLLQIVFMNNMIMERPTLYMSSFKMIIVAYLLNYLFMLKENREKLLPLFAVISTYLLFLSVTIIQGSDTKAAYLLFWQQ